MVRRAQFGSSASNPNAVTPSPLDGQHDLLITSASGIEDLDQEVNGGSGDGMTVAVMTPDVPYELTAQPDIDGVDGLTVAFQSRFARNGEPILKAANGANVGGLRFGFNSAVNDVEVINYGFDGNQTNQTGGSSHNAIEFGPNCDGVTLRQAWAQDLHPFQEHNSGGSAFVFTGADNITVKDVRCLRPGDRTLELFGVNGFDCEGIWGLDGYDRTVTIAYGDGSGCKNGSVETVRSSGNSDGSCVAVRSTNSSSYCENIVVKDVIAWGTHQRTAKADGYARNVHFEQISCQTADGSGGLETAFQDTVENITFADCLMDGPSVGVQALAGSTNVEFRDIHCVNNQRAAWIRGGADVVAKNVVGVSTSNGSFLADGGSDVRFEDCVAIDSDQTGFDVEQNGVTLESCVSQDSGGPAEFFIDAADVWMIRCEVPTTSTFSIRGGSGGGVYQGNVVPSQSSYNAASFPNSAETSGNYPPVPRDLTAATTVAGAKSYHDGSGSNTEGPAFSDGESWTSLVDGTTIS